MPKPLPPRSPRPRGRHSSRAGPASDSAGQAVRLNRQGLADSIVVFTLDTPAVALLEGRPETVHVGGPVTATAEHDRARWAGNVYRRGRTRVDLKRVLDSD